MMNLGQKSFLLWLFPTNIFDPSFWDRKFWQKKVFNLIQRRGGRAADGFISGIENKRKSESTRGQSTVPGLGLKQSAPPPLKELESDQGSGSGALQRKQRGRLPAGEPPRRGSAAAAAAGGAGRQGVALLHVRGVSRSSEMGPFHPVEEGSVFSIISPYLHYPQVQRPAKYRL